MGKKALKEMKTEVTVDKKHPGLWTRVNGQWKMLPEYQNLWWDYQKSRISRATFYRKKAKLKATYDALAVD
jgi:hypothetical protein